MNAPVNSSVTSKMFGTHKQFMRAKLRHAEWNPSPEQSNTLVSYGGFCRRWLISANTTHGHQIAQQHSPRLWLPIWHNPELHSDEGDIDDPSTSRTTGAAAWCISLVYCGSACMSIGSSSDGCVFCGAFILNWHELYTTVLLQDIRSHLHWHCPSHIPFMTVFFFAKIRTVWFCENQDREVRFFFISTWRYIAICNPTDS